MIAFAVNDQGVGIPKDQQRAVLERFVSRTQGSKHRGAGLGLSIVKSLVELHGGRDDARFRAWPGHHRDRALPRAWSRQAPLPRCAAQGCSPMTVDRRRSKASMVVRRAEPRRSAGLPKCCA